MQRGAPDVVSFDGAVHEGGVERHVPRAHAQALVAALEQRHGEALGARAAEEALRVLRESVCVCVCVRERESKGTGRRESKRTSVAATVCEGESNGSQKENIEKRRPQATEQIEADADDAGDRRERDVPAVRGKTASSTRRQVPIINQKASRVQYEVEYNAT
eukprot:5638482-Pleurochrysis_carterae.AAC.1